MTAAEVERLAREQRRMLPAFAWRRPHAPGRSAGGARDRVHARAHIRPQTAIAYVGAIAQQELVGDRRPADIDAMHDTLDALRQLKLEQARPRIARARLALPGDLRRLRVDVHEDNRCVSKGRAALRTRAAG